MIPLPPIKDSRPRDGGADVRSGKAGVRLSSVFTGFTGAHAGVSRQRTARPRLGEGFAQPPWGCWLKLPFALTFGPEIPAAAPQHARLAARHSEGAAIAFPRRMPARAAILCFGQKAILANINSSDCGD
jgi:hypothetical protein